MKENKKILSELTYLKGVGEKRALALAKDGIVSKKDLIFYFPRAYINRSAGMSVNSIKKEIYGQTEINSESGFDFNIKKEYTIVGQVNSKEEKNIGRNRKFLIIYLKDSFNGNFKIVFWNRVSYFSKIYQSGMLLSVSGVPEVDSYSGKVTFNHPDIDVIDEDDINFYKKGGILPVYRITENLRKGYISNKSLRKIIQNVLDDELHYIKENLTKELLLKYDFPNIRESIKNVHFPKSKNLLDKSIERFKYDEVFYFNLAIKLKREISVNKFDSVKINPKSKRARELYDKLPFDLTKDQKKVLNEIAADLSSSKAMNRLLQGDVGSGKTIVAVLIMLMAIDEGYQVAFMAPTEILAEQHFHTLNNFFKDLDVKVVQLVGGQKKKMRTIVLQEIFSGEANVIVGTHALFQSEIRYNKLALVVIDEQHRFGVAQRADLIKLGSDSFSDEQKYTPHILVMSATPIPRTLSMTFYGDLDVSVIKTMPKNRKPVRTKVVFESVRNEAFEFIRDKVKEGRQAFIVYPLVEKSEKLELKSAVEHYEIIDKEIFPEYKCGLLHGQLFWYEKEEAMQSFLSKEYDILVATTVIEVGIDIPNATVMLIENAERFGLSQLHQLRGRVGRGSEQSYCFLMTKDHFKYQIRNKAQREEEKKSAIIRLRTMEDTTDGFKIAEVDLKLRGPGDVMGTRQSGLPDFKFADLINDVEIISRAKNDVDYILKEDLQLRQEKYNIIRDNINKRIKNNDYFNIA